MDYIHIFECDGTQRSALVDGTLYNDDGGDARLVVEYLDDRGEGTGHVDVVRTREKYEVVWLPTLKDLLKFRDRGWRIPEKKS
jgi:hypothetical protein